MLFGFRIVRKDRDCDLLISLLFESDQHGHVIAVGLFPVPQAFQDPGVRNAPKAGEDVVQMLAEEEAEEKTHDSIAAFHASAGVRAVKVPAPNDDPASFLGFFGGKSGGDLYAVHGPVPSVGIDDDDSVVLTGTFFHVVLETGPDCTALAHVFVMVQDGEAHFQSLPENVLPLFPAAVIHYDDSCKTVFPEIFQIGDHIVRRIIGRNQYNAFSTHDWTCFT